MKLEKALQLNRQIKSVTQTLNQLIQEAATESISVEISVNYVTRFGNPSNFPVIEVQVKVNPEDLE